MLGDDPGEVAARAARVLGDAGALDGIARVEVDGNALAELGPGAVLGERALLEDGANPGTPKALAATLTRLGWTVEVGAPTTKGTQLDVVVREV